MLICEQRSVSVCAGCLNVNWWCKLVDDVLRVWKWSVLDDMWRVCQFECRLFQLKNYKCGSISVLRSQRSYLQLLVISLFGIGYQLVGVRSL